MVSTVGARGLLHRACLLDGVATGLNRGISLARRRRGITGPRIADAAQVAGVADDPDTGHPRASMAVADADADHDDIIAHLRIIGQRQEVSRTQDARSWLRIDLSHNDVSVTSSSERLSATNCAIWYSIAAWFCAVGGTIVAARIRPLPVAVVEQPAGRLATPVRGATSTNGRGGCSYFHS